MSALLLLSLLLLLPLSLLLLCCMVSCYAAWSATCCWQVGSQPAMGWCRLVVLFGAWQSSGCPGSQVGAGAGM